MDWGIPHLRAGSVNELALAQGRNVAVERAWQIEFERHRSQGTTAAFLGPEAVPWDTFARQVRLDDTARRCFRNLDDSTAAWLAAYVEGVNQGLPEGASRAPEFAAKQLEPGRWEPWHPLGVWLTIHVLFAGFPTKLWNEIVARHLGEDAIGLFSIEGASGSNGWMVTGDHTATGKPIIAGDPHRFIENPGVYQQIRLTCPEFDVVGFAVPGVPGIPHFGHAGGVAWAITNAMADYQDVYRERLRRHGNQVEALGPDGWRPAKVHSETIDVAGSKPVTVEVIETDRGPVIAHRPAGGNLGMGDPQDSDPVVADRLTDGAASAGDSGRVVADRLADGAASAGDSGWEGVSFRHPPRVTGELGFEALLGLLRGETVEDVDRAFDRWVEPVNVVLAADTQGGLLHRTAGKVPTRHERNKYRIVPAWEPEHQWRGWHDPMPRATVDGIAVMANERGLAEPLGVEFAPPHRADRIRTLLTRRQNWTAPDMADVHNDTRSGSTGAIVELLPADHRLRSWDSRMDADSTDAAAYAKLRSAVVRRLAAHPTLARLNEPSAFPEVFRLWLEPIPRIAFAVERLLATDALPGVVPAAIVKEALAEETDEARPWGETHRLTALHVFGPTPLDVPLSGDVGCVLAASSLPGVTDECWRGPVARYVWDLARRENSLWIVPLGASGVPHDPHHHDQTALWARGGLIRIGSDIEIVPVRPQQDIDLIYGWVTQERARFWGMSEKSREEVLEIYEYIDSLSTHHAYLLHKDGEPVALFQSYEPDADPVGERYDVRPGDIGAHFLIGPGDRRPGFTGSLFDAFIAFLLGDPAKDRVVAEPDVRNEKAISRLERLGFVLGKDIDVEGKRARLAFLTRESWERHKRLLDA